MSNEAARDLRNTLRKALRDRERDRAALLRRREECVHAVDERALADVAEQIGHVARNLVRAGGSLHDLNAED
jgi:hypothetical protein